MDSPKISIISICYNNENDVRDTIESVLSQTYGNIEYIIVDGASTDNSLNIINEYSEKVDKIISEPDNGIYDAINKGIKSSTGDIVGLIHAGDRLINTQVLGKIATHFAENEIDASYGHSIIVNSSDTPLRVNKSPEFKKSLFKFGWMPSHQSVYIKREVFDSLGLYRTDLGGAGDYEFILRYFYFNDLRVMRLDDFILKFALGGESTTDYHRIPKRQKVHVKCWKVNGESPPFYMVPIKLFRKINQFVLAFWYRFTKKHEQVSSI